MNKGDRVKATREIRASMWSGGDTIPKGSEGEVTQASSWGGEIKVSFILNGFLGERRVERVVDAGDIAKR